VENDTYLEFYFMNDQTPIIIAKGISVSYLAINLLLLAKIR